MSKSTDKSTPVPTPDDGDPHKRNQSINAPEGSRPKVNYMAIVIIVIIALAIIAVFAGWF